jgi:hypothetical protein
MTAQTAENDPPDAPCHAAGGVESAPAQLSH